MVSSPSSRPCSTGYLAHNSDGSGVKQLLGDAAGQWAVNLLAHIQVSGLGQEQFFAHGQAADNEASVCDELPDVIGVGVVKLPEGSVFDEIVPLLLSIVFLGADGLYTTCKNSSVTNANATSQVEGQG